MARRHYKLTAATVQGAKATGKQYRISDGSFGLMLNISRGGTKSWVQRIVICGVRRDLGIGSCHFVSLKDARFTAFENAKIARTGGDPRATKTKACTFLEAQEKCLAEKERRWKPGTRTGKYWRSTMATYVLPKIGSLPVEEVSQADIRHVLLPIAEAGKLVHAKAIGWRISNVLDWALSEGLRAAGNPVGAVLKSLPKRKTEINHHKAVHFSEVADALAKVDATQCHSGIKLALRFMVLTAARTKEIRLAEISDIDKEARVWRMPGSKTKNGRNHDVPLSDGAMKVLAEVERIGGGSGFVFTGKNGKPIGERSIRAALQDYAKVDATPHGMRSSFKEWCRDRDISDELSELSISHSIGDRTKTAYARSELVEKRRPIMEEWSRYLSTPERKEPTLDRFLAA